MPTKGFKYPTLLDHAQTTDPSGKTLSIVNIINETNELSDVPCIRGNLDMGELTSRKIGLPTIQRRKINGGITPSKQKVDQVTDTAVSYEGMAAIDYDLIKIADNKALKRVQESQGFLEAMAIEYAKDMFYGDSKDGTFDGFAKRYGKIGDQVISAKGTSNLSSLYCIGWAPDKITTFYPKNAPTAGIEHIPDEKPHSIDAPDGSGKMLGFEDFFKWMVGLSVKNPKYAARLANLDVDNTAINDLIALAIQLKNRIPSLKACMPRYYANERVYTALETAAVNKANVHLSIERISQDTTILSLLGIPIRRIDQLRNDETKIS